MEVGIFFSVIAIIILMLFSGFFSGSETALTAASRVRLHAREKDGDKRAAMVNRIREKKDRMIGALLLGNNLVNILASALATSVMIHLFGATGVVYATLIMTLLVLVFAEVLPKTYAFHHAEQTSLFIAPVIRWVIMVFSPVTEMVTWVVRRVLKLFGVDISRVGAGSHLELLRGVIELHRGPENTIAEQRAMLRSILDLVEVTVEDVMVHRQNVTMLDISLPTEKIIDAVLESPFSRFPLWKNRPDNIVGVLHAKNLLRELKDKSQGGDAINIAAVAMEPWFIPETTSLYDQLQAFRERREHFAIVVDEYGVFMGIVTLEDILEEIVGDIDDEQDISFPGVKRLQGGSYLVDGSVTIRDLKREFEWRMPDEHYSTLAGLILHESQVVPETGQSFSFYNFRFDIVRRDHNRLTIIKVTPPKKGHA